VRLRRLLRGLRVPIDMCWLTPEELKEAERLLRAARSDLSATRVLMADASQANGVIGFHAQQAVEKAIKAVLVAGGVEITYTHDLGLLLDTLTEHALAAPELVQGADWLTPWAVAARYGAV